jgi:hypothetical protein
MKNVDSAGSSSGGLLGLEVRNNNRVNYISMRVQAYVDVDTFALVFIVYIHIKKCEIGVEILGLSRCAGCNLN